MAIIIIKLSPILISHHHNRNQIMSNLFLIMLITKEQKIISWNIIKIKDKPIYTLILSKFVIIQKIKAISKQYALYHKKMFNQIRYQKIKMSEYMFSYDLIILISIQKSTNTYQIISIFQIIKIPTRNPITKKSQKTYNQTKSQSYPVQKILKISPKLKKQYVDYKKYEQIIESYHDFDQLQIKEVLGAGSNAVVKLASDNQQNYAIKIYEKYKLMNPNKLKIVYKEINLLKKIQHPNIPYLYNAYEDKKQIHIIMQYVEGITLYQYFKNNKFTLQIQIIKHIIKQLVNAISYLHQIDICHRDIKLQNILINTKTQQIKLIDFGYATYHNLKSVLQCGTPSYMAPQLFQKNCMYDPKKVDVWAIGILIYYLVLHFLPFKGYDQKDLIRRIKSNDYSIKIIDIKLMSLMNQLLEQDPMKRIDCNKILDCEWFK